LGVWENYKPPQLTTASSLQGQVVEVLSGDTLSILPTGQNYDSESKLVKLSLASIRSPRVGNERMGKADEPYAIECKDKLRQLTVGKDVKVDVHYERDIPLASGPEKRAFATISVGKHSDVGLTLVSEGLATVQFHKEGEEKSPNYDDMMLAEATAKAAKKKVHNSAEYKKPMTNDLTDPKKAKAYSGSLMRGGNLKAVVEYVFNGSRFKLFIPSENCHVAFGVDYIRCPQAGPPPSAMTSASAKKAEPFGDEAKRFARLAMQQRTVEIKAKGCTNGGVITGELFVGHGGQQRDYTLEILGAGLATLDERKLEYNEVPKLLVDAQTAAQNNKVGVWSVAQPKSAIAAPMAKVKTNNQVLTVKLAEIRSGAHIFYHLVGDKALGVMEESMKVFTKVHGTGGAPCDLKVGKVVAALFDDGSGKSWYRAKVLGRKSPSKVSVLFLDHGNVGVVNAATHLRPLDVELSTVRVPPVAKEATLALVHVRSIDDDDGIEAARLLQSSAWGKELTLVKHCVIEGKAVVTLYDKAVYGQAESKSINEELVAGGCGRVGKKVEVDALVASMVNGNSIVKLAAGLEVAQEDARKHRAGMWRYGDIGDEDPEEM
jgi:staphylococcal nuclease domain-containing protein 1